MYIKLKRKFQFYLKQKGQITYIVHNSQLVVYCDRLIDSYIISKSAYTDLTYKIQSIFAYSNITIIYWELFASYLFITFLWVDFVVSVYRMGKWSLGWLNNMSKVTHLVCGRNRIRRQIHLGPKPLLFTCSDCLPLI